MVRLKDRTVRIPTEKDGALLSITIEDVVGMPINMVSEWICQFKVGGRGGRRGCNGDSYRPNL
jgi:hypothetical protein